MCLYKYERDLALAHRLIARISRYHFLRRPVHHQFAMLQPECSAAQFLHCRAGVGDDEQTLARIFQFDDFLVAACLESGIAYSQHFVDDEEGRFDVNGHGKGETHHHAGGVGAQRLFNEIAHADAMGSPEQLAGGIGVALLTTAFGLTVAIPSMISYMYFLSRVDRLVMEIDALGQELVSEISAEELADREDRPKGKKKAA